METPLYVNRKHKQTHALFLCLKPDLDLWVSSTHVAFAVVSSYTCAVGGLVMQDSEFVQPLRVTGCVSIDLETASK